MLADHAVLACTPLSAVEALGLEDHPVVKRLIATHGRTKANRTYAKEIAGLIYHADDESCFMQHQVQPLELARQKNALADLINDGNCADHVERLVLKHAI